MLEFYFKSLKRLEQLRCSLLADHIGHLSAKTHRRGFERQRPDGNDVGRGAGVLHRAVDREGVGPRAHSTWRGRR